MTRPVGTTGRARYAAAALALCAVTVTACSTSDGIAPGAPTSQPRTGPSVVSTASLPPLATRVMPELHRSKRLPDGATQGLSNRIDMALSTPQRITPATRISGKGASSGHQLLVRWTVGTEPPDAELRTLVRKDIATILDLVKKSDTPFGTVLLLATGTVLEKAKRKITVVVRAKYSHRLVIHTDWARVPVRRILRLPDDKPAVIAPGWR